MNIFLKKLKNQLPEYRNQTIKISIFQNELDKISYWGLEWLLFIFQENSIFIDQCVEHQVHEIIEKLSILPAYHQLLKELLNLFVKKNLLNMPKENVYVLENRNLKLSKNTLLMKKEELEKKFGLDAHIDLLEAMLKNYLLITSGVENFLNFLFSEGSFDMVNRLYQGNPVADFYNNLTAIIIRKFLECDLLQNKKTSINILEIGAGSGSTTSKVLPFLNGLAVNEYRYTDISAAFLSYGVEKFYGNLDFLQFSKFDINQSAEKQGLNRRKYDIIFATNAIHNAHNLREALSEIYLLLNSGGILILNEGVFKTDYSTIVYGLSSSWWSFVDADLRIKGSPLLSTSHWKNLLSMTPFQNSFSLNDELYLGLTTHQDIIFALK